MKTSVRAMLVAGLLSLVMPYTALAQTASASPAISGVVDDASTGLPLANANVTSVGPMQKSTKTNATGRFTFDSLTPGFYQLRVSARGYQSALSDTVTVSGSAPAQVTLSLAAEELGSTTMRTIARTSTRASESLQRSSVVYKQQSIESIERSGTYRVADFLRTLPQVNLSAATGGSDTPSPGDDIYLDVRGIGGLETVALIDGHPVGFGINRGKNLGYNWEIAPTFALRSVQVTYGSGVSGLTPYSAVGGTINMLTLEPTPQREYTFTQGYGTYGKLVSSFNGTGTNGHLGYAFSVGSQGIDGPYKNDYKFQPAAAFDPSAPAGSLEHDSGKYKDDTAVVNRGAFGKLRWKFSDAPNAGSLTLSALTAAYWDDKTGNGDQDYLPYDTALALGNASLASYSAPTNTAPFTAANPQPCPSGQFTPTNANGAPWGYGVNGQPDGGKPCVTPQQYAQIAGGFQGAGAANQSFTLNDYHLRYDQPTHVGRASLDVYTNRFYQLYDRTFQLPFVATPGDNAFTISPQVTTTGGQITNRWEGEANDLGLGFATNNYAYLFKQNAAIQPSPIVHDNTMFLEDVFHPAKAPYSVYLNAAQVDSTITHTSNFDPRLAVVWNTGHNNVVRVASGATTVQPYATYISLPYSPIASGALNGNLNCTGLTTIGQVSNPSLRPERAVDEELSFGHRFAEDSQLQLTVYNENVNDKIYSTIIPVAGLPAGIIPANTLNQFQTAINAACGTSGLSGVGVNSQANVGRLLARGLDLAGRARFSHRLFADYDYSIESSSLKTADATTLQNNLTLMLGSQLPGVPLHKAQLALDATLGKNLDARFTQYWIASNNSKNSPAYNYGDFVLTVPVKRAGEFHVAVSNVFNQYTQYDGLIGHGYPVPLNQYATPANYQPLIGTSATELYGLPYRQIFISFTQHIR